MCTSLDYLRLSKFKCCSFLPGLLENVQNLKYLFLNVQMLSLPSSKTCYSCLEQVYIRSMAFTLTEDVITAITSGGKITHAYLHCSISKELIFHFIRNSPQLRVFYITTGREEPEAGTVEELNSVARSRGVSTFKMQRIGHAYVSLVDTKLLPIFCP